MGLLKSVLPITGALGLAVSLGILINPKSFLEAFDLASIGKEAEESPLLTHLLFLLGATRLALSSLAIASYFYGSETRFRVGVAMLFSRARPAPFLRPDLPGVAPDAPP